MASTGWGGTFRADGGAPALLFEDCTIRNTKSATSGSGTGFVMSGTTTLRRTAVSKSRAKSNSGCFHITAGRLTLEDSSLDSCTADGSDGFGQGGCFLVQGGEVDVSGSTLSNCSGRSGGAFYIKSSGAVSLYDTTIEFAIAKELDDGLRLEPGAQLQAVGLRLSPACSASKPLIYSEQPFTLTGVRNLSLVANPECPLYTQPPLLSDETELSTCESNPAACGPNAVCSNEAVNSLTSPHCRCEAPTFPYPGDWPTIIAPYTDGCALPRMAHKMSIEAAAADSVVLRLTKPASDWRTLRVEMRRTGAGSGDASTTWSIGAVPPWLVAQPMAGNISSTAANGAMTTLSCSSTGMRESVEPYQATLVVSVVSQQNKTFAVPVLVFVSARTEAVNSTWGSVGTDGSCTAPVLPTLSAVVNSELSIPFTACDQDGFPVDHALPSPTDSRELKLTINTRDGAAGAVPYQVHYQAHGVYHINLVPMSTGEQTALLAIGEEVVGSVTFEARCSAEQEVLPSGGCGCPAGLYLDAKDGGCKMCEGDAWSFTGSTSCEICRKGTYRVEGLDFKCSACLDGATCGANTTLQTAALNKGRWRLSPASRELSRCRYSKMTATAFTPCAGGDDAGMKGEGYCAAGHHGLLCEVCNAPASEQYFEPFEARCIGCPDVRERIATALAVICAALLGLLGLCRLLQKLPWSKWAATRVVQYVANRAANKFRRYVLLPKLKLFIALFQAVFAVPEIYGVELPEVLH